MLFTRPDGRRLRSLDPFALMIPYIMVHRYDATNTVTFDLEYDRIKEYLQARKDAGNPVTLMALIIAAYVRTCAAFPEVNRFIVSKKIYARKDIRVSFVTLKSGWNGEGEQPETTVTLVFNGTETLHEVSAQLEEAIADNRKPDGNNAVDRLIASIFSVPILPGGIVALLKWLDRINMLPQSVLNISPFHASLFFTNMASIRGPVLNHHLYDFGTVGQFLALGYTRDKNYAFGATIDERLANGATYMRAARLFQRCLYHPERLETPPDEVKQDVR